ncbi:hypothetical protein GALL_287500 [mine drainage metagenome]|uniref:(2Fe-2S) ferredoxin domain-containing protein n=1 Tax=mine drainage metagenome TaxID=410659 RepID=A0A1J5R097_9ZZZZ
MFPCESGHRRCGPPHRRHQRRRRHAAFCETAMAPVAAAGPTPPQAGAGFAPLRLFVCMGRDCRAGRSGPPLIEAVRQALAEAGPAAAHISALSCPCLDRCEDGPLILAYGGEAARQTRPPSGPLAPAPLASFTHVEAARLPALIARLISP